MPRWTALATAALVAIACRSPEERLMDRRNDLRRDLDSLYADYRASAGGDADKGDRERGAGGEASASATGFLGRVVAELDRASFEETCLALGRGERPFILSDRLAAFVADSGHADRCRRAARVAADVAALEREAGNRSRRAP